MTFVLLKHEGCCKYEIFCIRSERTDVKYIPGLPFVNDKGVTTTNMTRFLFFIRKLQAIYRGKKVGPPFFLLNFHWVAFNLDSSNLVLVCSTSAYEHASDVM